MTAIAALLLGAMPCSAQAPVDLRDDPAIVEVVDRHLMALPDAMDAAGLGALSVAIVDTRGPVILEAFGAIDDAGEVATTVDTIFSQQSISKTFTATAVLRAVQAGKLDLDESILTYLPDFRVNSSFEERPERRMTLRHLLSHRAGFAHEAPIGNNYRAEFSSFQAHVDSISETWLRARVGERFAYSNLGIDLAGRILEVVFEKSFADVMRDEVLAPIGMRGATFDWDVIRAREDRARGNEARTPKLPLEFALIPSGGLYASASDMAAFLSYQLAYGRVGESVVLAEEHLDEMFELQFASEFQNTGYGLGIDRRFEAGQLCYSHGGGGFGFQAFLGWYPDLGIGIAVLTNSVDQSLVWDWPAAVIRDIVRVNGAEPSFVPEIPDPDVLDVDVEELAHLVGTYAGDGVTIEASIENDRFGLRTQGSTFLPLHVFGVARGYVQAGPERMHFAFAASEDGRPRGMLCLDNGRFGGFSHGPYDPPGSDEERWSDYEGEFEVRALGVVVRVIQIERRDGHLWFDGLRLSEHLPGLFFTTDGERIDFRGETPSWRNVEMTKL